MKTLAALLLLGFCCGCTAVRLPVKAYHGLYCDQMNADKIHCDRWATQNGELHP